MISGVSSIASQESGNITKTRSKKAQAGSKGDIEYYKNAADAGDINAMSNLGAMYLQGQRVKQDYKVAEKYFRQAADAGNTSAMNSLGVMYLQGQGVKQDYEVAEKYFRQAAEAGDTNAKIGRAHV